MQIQPLRSPASVTVTVTEPASVTVTVAPPRGDAMADAGPAQPEEAAPAAADPPAVVGAVSDNFVSTAGGGDAVGQPAGAVVDLEPPSTAAEEKHVPLMQRVPNLCPPLSELCTEVIAANFKGEACFAATACRRVCGLPLPCPLTIHRTILSALSGKRCVDNVDFDAIPPKYQTRVVEILPTDLPLEVVCPQISDDYYWERRAMERWKDCNVVEHGGRWKRLYLERNLQDEIEALDENQTNLERLIKVTSAPAIDPASRAASLEGCRCVPNVACVRACARAGGRARGRVYTTRARAGWVGS